MLKKIAKALSFILLYCSAFFMVAQPAGSTTAPDLLNNRWPAQWITVPNSSPDGYGVYMFRKAMDLSQKPTNFKIHVSADNRYKMFINAQLVSMGPARGDVDHWNYETVDIGAFLKAGKNIIAVQVWNEGPYKPEAQMSYRTGLIVQGAGAAEALINTNSTWLCDQDKSYAPLRFRTNTYYVAGAGELRTMALSQKQWQQETFDDTNWHQAASIAAGVPKNILGAFGTISGWMLQPSILPQMELRVERLQRLVHVAGINTVPERFPALRADITIPARTHVKLLLDQGFLTNAYPYLAYSGGTSAHITIKYAEALFTKSGSKAHRNEIADKIFVGRADSLLSDGSQNQSFTSLSYRTYRYVLLSIYTQEEPLTIHDFYGTFTGYPFQMNAKLSTQNTEMDKMLEVGWRTARLCAYETYMDCPYYEQLQYIGDGRIQVLISMYNSGDDRLVKNALNLMDYSRRPEGVTLSRHPSYTPQYIPTFSLWYIAMLHDYAMYGADIAFVKDKMPGISQILHYFKKYQQADGSLKNCPQWMFTDWVEAKDWNAGVGPMSANGTSAILDFQLLWAYQIAADLENKLGTKAIANQYLQAATVLKQSIRKKYWDSTQKLFADREEKDLYSQHSNALAILTGVASPAEQAGIARQLLENKALAPASIYFKYYLHQALIKAGQGNSYLSWLDKWRENLAQGLSTWAETSDIAKTRSDCHAWGASPNIEFFRTVLGIDSQALAFSKVKIEPHLGALSDVKGSIPHPKGQIYASYRFEQNRWMIEIVLPETVSGSFLWKGKILPLKGGHNQFKL